MKYAYMKGMRPQYSIPFMSRLLKVSASGYYAWLTRKVSKREQEEARLEIEIKAAHKRTRETFGPIRLQKELLSNGIKAGICRIRRIRRKLGIYCKQKRRFKATTDSRHTLPVADNLLNQQFKAETPNKVWVTDITYIPTEEGFVYLSGHKDIYTKEIVGYAMDDRMTKELISKSLLQGITKKRPDASGGLIHHSDRGRQYCSYEYLKTLEEFKIKPSMSRKGNCYDNAPMESFWGTLKSELTHHKRYKSRDEAIRDIQEYIEVFYNRQRIQEKLGYLSPAAYEQQFYQRQVAA